MKLWEKQIRKAETEGKHTFTHTAHTARAQPFSNRSHPGSTSANKRSNMVVEVVVEMARTATPGCVMTKKGR